MNQIRESSTGKGLFSKMLVNHSLLYNDTYPLKEGVNLRNPTVKDVLDFGEEKYNSLINLFLLYPIDLILEIFEMCGRDFEAFYALYSTLKQYDIFMMLYMQNIEYYNELMGFFFIDGVNFVPYKNVDTGEIYLGDDDSGLVFDLTSYMVMSRFIMAIHGLKEDIDRGGTKTKRLLKLTIETDEANREYDLREREKKKMDGKLDNQLRKTINKITVASQFKRKELEGMLLYEFNAIVSDVMSYNYWQFRMIGLYSGNVDLSKLKPDARKEYTEWFNT